MEGEGTIKILMEGKLGEGRTKEDLD